MSCVTPVLVASQDLIDLIPPVTSARTSRAETKRGRLAEQESHDIRRRFVPPVPLIVTRETQFQNSI